MADQGIKIAAAGYDVNTCPDFELIFNSSWPSLAIAFETTFTGTNAPATVAHNLGFPPLTMAWVIINGVNYGRIPSQNLEVDSVNIDIFYNIAPVNYKLLIRCYNLDISQDNTYPLPVSAQVKLPYDSTFGIKVAKYGKNIASNDLNDFILHSRAQSPAVLDVITNNGKYFINDNNGARLVYPLRTKFLPWFLATIDLGGMFSYFPPTDVVYNPTANTLTYTLAATGAGSLIILRDPLLPATNKQVIF